MSEEDYDFDNIPAETPLEHRPEEAILRRHRREKKDLQGKILSMKKSVNKSDKKRKKELDAEIVALESELNLRHKMELDTLQLKLAEAAPPSQPQLEQSVDGLGSELSQLNVNAHENNPANSSNALEGKTSEAGSTPGTPKISRAQKRRDKKSTQQRAAQKRIDLETEELVENSLWKKEDNEFAKILNELGLKVFDIPSDGDCLYSAISHQLDHHGQQDAHSARSLRQLTSSYLLDHKEEFLPFMEENVTSSDDAFKNYCTDIALSSVWGGQLEVHVLSKFLQVPIRIIQTDTPPLVFGEEFPRPTLTLTYHRHKIHSGEHYNSTVPRTPDDNETI